MRHRNPNTDQDIKICLLKSNQSIRKQEKFVRNKQKITELLRNIGFCVWQIHQKIRQQTFISIEICRE